jgi:hypothetical protein
MAHKIGQIIRRGSSTWLVRIYAGATPKTDSGKTSVNSFVAD